MSKVKRRRLLEGTNRYKWCPECQRDHARWVVCLDALDKNLDKLLADAKRKFRE